LKALIIAKKFIIVSRINLKKLKKAYLNPYQLYVKKNLWNALETINTKLATIKYHKMEENPTRGKT